MLEARSGLQTSRKHHHSIMKTITTLTATLGAALLLAGAPALASADQTGPIRIDSVHLVSQALTEHEVAPVAAQIAFTNEGTSAATDVVFALESESGYVLDSYNDVGSFAPGVSVRHSFNDHNDASNGEQVVVAKATFADGTVWSNPDVTTEPAATPSEGVQVVSYSLDY